MEMQFRYPFLNIEFTNRSDTELTPSYIFNIFSQFSLDMSSSYTYSYNHNSYNTDTIRNIEEIIYPTKYYGDNKQYMDKNKGRFLKALSSLLIEGKKDSRHLFNRDKSSIISFFSRFCDQIYYYRQNFGNLVNLLLTQTQNDLREMPIKTSDFPHFISQSNSNQNNQDNNSQNDEEQLSSILEPNRDNNNNDNERDSVTLFSLNELIQFYDILCKHPKSFSFSPKFINIALKKFDDFLVALQSSTEDNQNQFDYFRKLDQKSDKFIQFKMVLLIKMRLFMLIHRMHDFLIVLLQLIIIDQESTQKVPDNDQFSFKNIINDILPKCSTRRSTVFKNVSSNQILDFSFNNSDQNDFVVTEEGVFKIIRKSNEPIEFKDHSILQKVEFPAECYENIKNNVKIAFSNGILYLLCFESKTVFKKVVSEDEEIAKKAAKKKKKIDNAKEHSTKEHPKKKETQENKNASKKPKSDKMTQKKLREKAKKEKRLKRKIERFEDEEINKVDLDSIKIDIPDFPILSFGSYNNYLRIVQRKDDKTLILTNVDLIPNERINYDFDDIFNTTPIDTKFTQTQFEIEIQINNNVLLSEDYLYFSSNNSSFQKWIIYKDGKAEFAKRINCPFLLNSNSIIKMDNNSFLYILLPFENKGGFSIDQMYLPETKHWFQSENGLFIEYPYLQNLSNIVDNCTEFILNRDMFSCPLESELFERSYRYKKKTITKKKLKLIVSPDEMSSCVQHPKSIEKQLENIVFLIKELKDENLKRFFISLFIKLTGIIFIYEINKFNFDSNIDTKNLFDSMKKYRSFILDLYSLTSPSISINSDIIIRESMLFTLSISGKLLFAPDSYQQLHDIINQILFKNDQVSPILLKSFSEFIFSNISSLYIIDKAFYEKLMEFEKEININNLFKLNILFVSIDSFYSDSFGEEFYISILPYIDALFQHLQYNFKNESVIISVAEELLTYILPFDEIMNILLSLVIEKKFVELCPFIYERLSKIPEVIESDKDFLEKNQDLKKIDIQKEIKILETKHPYNPAPVPVPFKKVEKKKNKPTGNNYFAPFGRPLRKKPKQPKKNKKLYFEDVGTIDFGLNADIIYIQFDNQTSISESDAIFIYSKSKNYILSQSEDLFNQRYTVNSNRIRVAIGRNIKDSQEVKEQLWGLKMTVTGVKTDNSIIWRPNFHLKLYNYFIATLATIYTDVNNSTKLESAEKEFKFVLNNNIIQGIKLEDIDNYEKANNNNNNNNENENQLKLNKSPRGISRGSSRGITYDSQDEFKFDAQIKKSFLNRIIAINDDYNKQTPEKRLIDALYKKTAKQNRIPINKFTHKILESEIFFAACLFKQLGLIATCINFLQKLNNTKTEEIQNIEFPNQLLSLMKIIYSLRKSLFFEYQKSKSIMNTNSNSNQDQPLSSYEQLLKGVNQKCKLLIYSHPILQFKEKEELNNELLDSTAKLILSFVTSKIPLSDISKLIDTRRKRLDISKQSIVSMIKFFEKNLLFESSKQIFACFNSAKYPIKHFSGVKQSELEEYNHLLALIILKMTENVFSQQSISILKNQKYLLSPLLNIQKNELTNNISKILIDMLVRNKNRFNNAFYNTINFNLIQILIIIAAKTEDINLINYVTSLLNLEEIDFDCKNLILVSIYEFIQFMDIKEKNNLKIFDESFAFSILSNNMKNPDIVKHTFYWISILFNKSKQDSKEHQEFILKVFKGIGRSFSNKSCLFIEDSNLPISHISISLNMIAFIRLLFNNNNKDLFTVIHDILTNQININHTKFNEMVIPIGLFISFGLVYSENSPIKAGNFEYLYRSVLLENKQFDLNEKEIDNILSLHEFINNNSNNYFDRFNENPINNDEITENIFIYSFYSFISMIMQIKNNVSLLMNDKNIKRALSFFEFSMKPLPTPNNSIESLTDMIIFSMTNPIFLSKSNLCNQSKFMKLNFGEVIYKSENENDLIKTNKTYTNIFVSNRPFTSKIETYYEVKINKIENKNVFIGFIDGENHNFDDAFGFGCFGNQNVFSRKSMLLASSLNEIRDEIMKNKQIIIKEGDTIGCYYTPDYTYLTMNGQLMPYRNPNKSLNYYIPIIIIDKNEAELEIVRNVTIVDDQFEFLKKSDEFFEENDIKTSSNDENKKPRYCDSRINNNYNLFIGNKVMIDRFIYNNSDTVSLNPKLKELHEYTNSSAIILDIIPLKDDPYVAKLKVKAYNRRLQYSDDIEIDSRFVTTSKICFFYIVEKQINTFFATQISYINMNTLPEKLLYSNDFDHIKQYTRRKMIQDSTRSVAILSAKYLSSTTINFIS